MQLLLILLVPALCAASESWETILGHMPLRTPVLELQRTNCVRVMLAAFQSNDVVKALIFLPGATDEFYMFRRAQARLAATSPTLLDAVAALTNQTRIQATFRAPFLLLHTDTDPIEPKIEVRNQRTADKLARTGLVPYVLFNDSDWDSVQPRLKNWLKADVKPWRYSIDSFHFYRCALAGWNLNGREILEAVALASQTSAGVDSRAFPWPHGTSIRFELETRGSGIPTLPPITPLQPVNPLTPR